MVFRYRVREAGDSRYHAEQQAGRPSGSWVQVPSGTKLKDILKNNPLPRLLMYFCLSNIVFFAVCVQLPNVSGQYGWLCETVRAA